MNETRINARWGYRKDDYQTILIEHYMSEGGRNPRTGEIVGPRPKTRETYHPTLRAAVLAAMERESGACEDLESLLRLTDQWQAVADQFGG